MSSAASKPLYDEIRELMALYPEPRSATLPALRLGQEKHGWLSPDALREVAEGLGETPAYCMAVASSATNEGARNLTRHGFGPPSETT